MYHNNHVLVSLVKNAKVAMIQFEGVAIASHLGLETAISLTPSFPPGAAPVIKHFVLSTRT